MRNNSPPVEGIIRVDLSFFCDKSELVVERLFPATESYLNFNVWYTMKFYISDGTTHFQLQYLL